jgi:hypothetical protein
MIECSVEVSLFIFVSLATVITKFGGFAKKVCLFAGKQHSHPWLRRNGRGINFPKRASQ